MAVVVVTADVASWPALKNVGLSPAGVRARLFARQGVCRDVACPGCCQFSWHSRAMEQRSNQQIVEAGLADWRKLAQALHARWAIPDYTVAAAFVTAVAKAAEADGHHPDLRLTSGVIDVSLCTRQDGLWITQQDIDLARRISEIADGHGLRAEPGAVTQLEMALDTAHEDGVAPFWSALLTGSPDNTIHDSVFDPTGRVPNLWFQGTEDHQLPPALALRPLARRRGGGRTDRRSARARRLHRR